MPTPVFTIGHSTHTVDEFLALLRAHGITAVCDVRSRPYSGYNPQFNRQAIEERLAEVGIRYVFLGAELGARTDDPSCYRDGKVQYERLAQTEPFRRGIERVREGVAKGFHVALMCAEKEPLECHRTILVARRLVGTGVPVRHIHADGSVETQEEAVARLTGMLRVPGPDLFRTEDDVVEDAYRKQGERIAYKAEENEAADAP